MSNFNVSMEGIGGLIAGIGSAAKDIRAAITGKSVIDPDKQAEIELKLLELENKAKETETSVALAQAEINKVEAASTNPFVSGWRPFLGWVLSVCAGVYFLPRFVLGMSAWTVLAFKVITSNPADGLPVLPDMGFGDLLSLLGGILGLSLIRMNEKVKGVAAK